MTGPNGRVASLLLVLTLLSLNHGVTAQMLRDDEQRLVAFLRNVLPDYPVLFNSSIPTCEWEGIACIGLGAQQRIYRLTFGGLKLNGSIPENTLGALTALTVLDLSNNFLRGNIPNDIWNLPNLMHLGLGDNRFTGSLPQWINLYQLMKLDLSGNLLNGSLPVSLGDLRSLKFMDLHGNYFSGPMPALGNTKFLRYLDLSSNRISGGVPSAAFFSLSQDLTFLNLSRNLMTGPFSAEFNWLWKLRVLDLSENSFEGSIPDLSNLGQVRQLHLSWNRLNGSLPFNVTRIPYLRSLSVANNQLSGPLPPLPWGLSSDKIRVFDCSSNSLTGNIPEGLLASENLTVVRMASNLFTGSIPSNITTQLRELDLSNNNLTGDIPARLASLPFLEKLDLSGNQLNGSIPSGLTEVASLQHLSLAGNQFDEGVLPDLSQKGSLMYLNLSSCNRNGSIPDSIGEVRSLVHLDVSHNHVTGSIPANLSQATNLTSLDVSHNNLTGSIPPALASLMLLSRLDVSFNNLSGEVPTQWGESFSNQSFEGNSNLCGVVVSKPCTSLVSPSSAPSPRDTLLSPEAPSRPPIIVPPIHHHTTKELEAGAIVGIVIGLSLALCALLSTYTLFHRKQRKFKKGPRKDNSSYLTGPVTFESDPCAWASQVPQPASIPVIMFEKPLLNLTFADLLQATSKFHKESQISDGRYGPTFKGMLPGGFQIVVKVLYDGGPANELEKAAQLEALGKIRHENLVCLVGYCLAGGERLLVYEFMENGDVHQRLHDSPDETHHPENWTKETWADANEKFIMSEELGWPIRHRVAVGVARALAFLHHGCVPNVIHRDVTSANIMLDSQYEPHLADCGLAGLVESGARYETPVMGGTLGYLPPEYGQTWKVTSRGDVYSFGVVLLELVTGKRPTGQHFHDSYGGNLVGWVRMLIRDKRGYKCLDPKLLSTGVESEMLETLRIGYLCTAECPSKRPTMQQVVGLLKDIHVDVVACM